MVKYGIIKDFSPSHIYVLYAKALFLFVVYSTIIAYLYKEDGNFAEILAPFLLKTIPVCMLISFITQLKYEDDVYYRHKRKTHCPFCNEKLFTPEGTEEYIHAYHLQSCAFCNASVEVEYKPNFKDSINSEEIIFQFYIWIASIILVLYLYFDWYSFFRDVAIAMYFIGFFISSETSFAIYENVWKKADPNEDNIRY